MSKRTWIFFFATLLFIGLASTCREGKSDNGDRPEAGVVLTLDSLVKRVAIRSSTMGQIFNAHVILPESYYLDTTPLFYPVVYLLHGYSGHFDDWFSRVPELVDYATSYNYIIVTPEGLTNSWYFDSPLDSNSTFRTYISQDVPAYIDDFFRTKPGPQSRAITGLSMGGHGALSIGLRHPEWFGAAGSMSGVLYLPDVVGQFELEKHLGDPVADSLRWQGYSVLNLIDSVRTVPQLIIDCGTDDFLIQANRRVHDTLLVRNFPHTYIERPGGHAWNYWSEAVAYQLQYFARYFGNGR